VLVVVMKVEQARTRVSPFFFDTAPTGANATVVYATNYNSASVTSCVANSTGMLVDCSVTTISGCNNPGCIAISKGYAYICCMASSIRLRVCQVNMHTGDLSGCVASTFPSLERPTPRGFAFNDSQTYVASLINTSSISLCTVDASTGLLSDCASAGDSFNLPRSIALYGSSFAYVANQYPGSLAGDVLLCNVEAVTGKLTGCATARSAPQPTCIAVYSDRLYISGTTTTTLTVCDADASTGSLSGCVTTGGPFTTPVYGFVITPGFAYITEYSTNDLQRCVVDQSTGLLSDCVSTGNSLASPYSAAATFVLPPPTPSPTPSPTRGPTERPTRTPLGKYL